MEEIIAPINKEILKAELTEDKRLRFTNKSHNEIYVITYQDSPNVMKEIGRLREIAFRAAGGGTGKSMDIDEYDIMENPYKQLVVWNPEAEEILGGYRYLLGDEAQFDEHGKPLLATAHMFNFSETFLKEYLPYTVELGRSFVTLEYQSTRAGSKGLFALDNLWDGLGALTVIKPNVKYFFGKMTMYPSYHRQGRDMILYFLRNIQTFWKKGTRTCRKWYLFFNDEKNKKAFSNIWKQLEHLVVSVLPKRLKLWLKYSTGSPDTTGQVLGILAIFPVGYRNHWNIIPDFTAEEFYAEADFTVHGRIFGVQILALALRIILDKNCRRLYNRFKHMK